MFRPHARVGAPAQGPGGARTGFRHRAATD